MCLSFRRDFAPSITRQFWVLFLLKYSFCSSESKLELIRLSHRNSPTDLRQREREIYGYGKYGWISIAKRNKNWQFVDFRNKLLYYLKIFYDKNDTSWIFVWLIVMIQSHIPMYLYVCTLFIKKKRSMQPKKMHYITWTTITTHIEIFQYPEISTQQLIQQKSNFWYKVRRKFKKKWALCIKTW